MRKYISVCSLLLFIVPTVTLLVCHQMHTTYTNIYTIPFIDGKVSISLIGRQDYTIRIFKPGFFIYMLISVFFYFMVSKFLVQIEQQSIISLVPIIWIPVKLILYRFPLLNLIPKRSPGKKSFTVLWILSWIRPLHHLCQSKMY